MGQENPRAHQAHNRCNRLNHRKNPLRPTRGTERPEPCTVKKIQWLESKMRTE